MTAEDEARSDARSFATACVHGDVQTQKDMLMSSFNDLGATQVAIAELAFMVTMLNSELASALDASALECWQERAQIFTWIDPANDESPGR